MHIKVTRVASTRMVTKFVIIQNEEQYRAYIPRLKNISMKVGSGATLSPWEAVLLLTARSYIQKDQEAKNYTVEV